MTAKEIIQALGNDQKLADALGVRITVVNAWKRVNFIPEWRREPILRVAMSQGVPLTLHDFPDVEERLPKVRAAA